MTIRVIVTEGSQIPRGYGMAWAQDFSRSWVCYPIPLNWIMAWLRRGYGFLGHGPRDLYMEAFTRGMERGSLIEQQGAARARMGEYERGRLDGVRETLETLRSGFAR